MHFGSTMKKKQWTKSVQIVFLLMFSFVRQSEGRIYLDDFKAGLCKLTGKISRDKYGNLIKVRGHPETTWFSKV